MTEPTAAPARRRHDAFDGAKKRRFLDALGKRGCVRDAARKAGVSPQTVYNHQARDPGFARQCELALDMAGTDVELHAWERGVAGIKEALFDKDGEVVGYRVTRSDNILRLLLQGAKPKKYGRNPGFKRKRLLKIERDNIRREVKAEHYARMDAEREDNERLLMDKLGKMFEAERRAKLRAGWQEIAPHQFIPPGWVRAEGWAALAHPDVPHASDDELDAALV